MLLTWRFVVRSALGTWNPPARHMRPDHERKQATLHGIGPSNALSVSCIGLLGCRYRAGYLLSGLQLSDRESQPLIVPLLLSSLSTVA